MDGISPKNLMDLVNSYVEGRVQIGRIDFYTRYSLFDVEEVAAKRVIQALRELDFLGRQVKVDFATDEQMERGNKERSDFGGRPGNAPYGKRDGGYNKSRSNYGGNKEGYGQRRDDNSRGKDDYGKRSFSAYGKKDYGKKDAPFGGKSKEGYPRKRY